MLSWEFTTHCCSCLDSQFYICAWLPVVQLACRLHQLYLMFVLRIMDDLQHVVEVADPQHVIATLAAFMTHCRQEEGHLYYNLEYTVKSPQFVRHNISVYTVR